MRKKSTSNAKTNLRDIYWKQSNLHSHCSSQKKQSVHMKCGCYIRFHGISTKELGERLCSNQILEISNFFTSWNALAQPLAIDQFNSKYICIWDIFSGKLSEKSHTHTHKNNILANNIFYQLRYFCVVAVPEAFGPLFYVHFFGPLEGWSYPFGWSNDDELTFQRTST